MFKSQKLIATLLVALLVMIRYLFSFYKKYKKPEHPKKFLIAHYLLLGDTLMLTSFLAHLRLKYPNAEIYVMIPAHMGNLYQEKPYGIIPLYFNPRKLNDYLNIFIKIFNKIDIAYIFGDNKYSLFAYAGGSQWIVGLDENYRNYKNKFINEMISIPNQPMHWEEISLKFIDSNLKTEIYFDSVQWNIPIQAIESPSKKFIILHVGASHALKYWNSSHWQKLIKLLENTEYEIVFTASKKEEFLIKQIDPNHEYKFYTQYNLVQIYYLIRKASLMVCLDTGIAHLGKLTETPLIVLFGQGNPTLYGKGQFFKQSSYEAVQIEHLSCRNQACSLFKRNIPWAIGCNLKVNECQNHICMSMISPELIYEKIKNQLNQ